MNLRELNKIGKREQTIIDTGYCVYICAKEKWRINADIVIDDKPETLENFMLKYKPPFAVVKISQPWNATTICDYTWNEFNNGLARFCIDAAESYADVIREIRQEQEDNGTYERCYYN